MKELARITAVVLLTIGLIAVLWQFSGAVLLFLLSLFIAATARPLAIRLMDRGVPRALAHTIVYVGGIVTLVSLIIVISAGLLNEIQRAGDDLLERYTIIAERWPQGTELQRSVAEGLPGRQELIDELAGDRGSKLAGGVVGLGSGIFDLLAQLIVVMSLSVYWANDQERFERLWLSLLNAKHRARARFIWRSVEIEVGAYVRSELTQTLLGAVTLGLIFNLLGLPYPILLAIWVGLVWLVPWVGVALAMVPVALVGLAVGWPTAILAVLATIAVSATLEIFVEPRMYGRSRISPLLVVIVLMVMAQHAGVVGMLLAPLLAATIQITCRELFFKPPAPAPERIVAAQLNELRKRLTTVRLDATDEGVMNGAELQSLVAKIQQLIDKATEALEAEGLLNQPIDSPPMTGGPTPQPIISNS